MNYPDIPADVNSAIAKARANAHVDPYADAYASMLEVAYARHGKHGLAVQILYLLNHMSKWRGDEAKQAKAVLRKWADNN